MLKNPNGSEPSAAPDVRQQSERAGAQAGPAAEPSAEPGWSEIKEWVKERPWPVALFLGLVCIAAMAWATDACVTYPWIDVALPLVILLWIGLLFAWFIMCFTKDAYEQRTRAIEFAYFFMVLSFCLVAVMIADMGKARKFGVVEGCIENLDFNNVWPIQCNYPIKGSWSGTPVDAKNAATPGGAPPASGTVPTHAELLANYRQNENYHYLLNIGGRLTELRPVQRTATVCQAPVYAVRGGLPVPVYFIVLALIGGAISLAKNVPGIQKRSDAAWNGGPTEPRLAPGEVRELLLFQVLQFVSAPFLAVAAYHTIKPESFGTTVTLGFLVGFASDQILGTIRSMVKGVQPSGAAAPTLTGSINGTVTQGSTPVVNAAVSLLSTTLTARTDDKGQFTLLGVPVKNEPYTLRASAADRVKEVSVTVKDPGAVSVKVDLAATA